VLRTAPGRASLARQSAVRSTRFGAGEAIVVTAHTMRQKEYGLHEQETSAMTEPQIPIYHSAGMRRRAFLQTLGLASGSLVLAGLPSLSAQTGQGSSSSFQLKAPEANPKYGGTLRYGILSAPAHFDVHQSGTVSNMASQGPMYDNLIRRHPLDCQTINPDLAQSW
jgi:hypothetical protein